MRINVYTEELTPDVRLVEKRDVVGEDGNLVTFYGVRMFMKSSPDLHQTPTDDDRTAITFWFRATDQWVIDQLFSLALTAAGCAPIAAGGSAHDATISTE